MVINQELFDSLTPWEQDSYMDWLEREYQDRQIIRPTLDHDGFEHSDEELDALWEER